MRRRWPLDFANASATAIVSALLRFLADSTVCLLTGQENEDSDETNRKFLELGFGLM
ncbi:MAG TPA: hypothetical protein VKK81_17230 [Candidatus Binatia bacterium]|nr:hypothetical protein [Candidatus Binatia bacterium]